MYGPCVSTNDEGKKRAEPVKSEPVAGRIVPVSTKTDSKTDRSGLVPSAVYLALDVADKSNTTAVGVLQDVRGEIRAAVEGSLDLAENLTKAFFRVGRRITQRLDEATSETLSATEKLVGSAVKSARDTTRAAADLATTAVSGVVGETKPSLTAQA